MKATSKSFILSRSASRQPEPHGIRSFSFQTYEELQLTDFPFPLPLLLSFLMPPFFLPLFPLVM